LLEQTKKLIDLNLKTAEVIITSAVFFGVLLIIILKATLR